ncbi:hypothetical protein [Paracidobacterium acidisoli]|uniref:Uncharacterized protein n=1 Tax=Paracidobacterium acidisoli TaxID=2303751 RepID=A0A372IKN2_9BACT|nr:hypothetical protein [Paracidobacterium acidisoli]MBT9332804.1 hypothetical protein [Paracidobacterium acidisoli]
MALKSGFENKKKVAILGVLLAVLVIVAIYEATQFFGGSSPAPAASAPAAAPAAAPASASSAPAAATTAAEPGGNALKVPVSLTSLDPTLHPEVMAGAEALEYSGNGRNIFSMNSVPAVIEAVRGPVRPNGNAAPAAVAQMGPPPPPPIALRFFGYEAEGGHRKAFLIHGDDIFIAAEGDVVDHHYRVLKINPMSIEVTDLLYNNTQTLPLVQS